MIRQFTLNLHSTLKLRYTKTCKHSVYRFLIKLLTSTPRVGLEPTTPRLTAACSTIELSRKMKKFASQIISEECLRHSSMSRSPWGTSPQNRNRMILTMMSVCLWEESPVIPHMGRIADSSRQNLVILGFRPLEP